MARPASRIGVVQSRPNPGAVGGEDHLSSSVNNVYNPVILILSNHIQYSLHIHEVGFQHRMLQGVLDQLAVIGGHDGEVAKKVRTVTGIFNYGEGA